MMLEERFVYRFIVTFRVDAENAGCICRHRRINVNRNDRYFFSVGEQVQIENKFLRAFDCERRNDDFSFFGTGVADNALKFLHCEFSVFVLAVAVRTFKNDIVRWRHIYGRISDNRFFLSSDVAGKKNARFFRAVCYCKIRKS